MILIQLPNSLCCFVLDKVLFDDYLCLVTSNIQQINWDSNMQQINWKEAKKQLKNLKISNSFKRMRILLKHSATVTFCDRRIKMSQTNKQTVAVLNRVTISE